MFVLSRFGQPALLFAGQFQLQLRCDLLCDCLFDCNQVGNFAIVFFAPKLRACHRVHQIYLNVQSVLHLPHFSCQHRRHLQLAPDLPRIDIFSFVMKSRRACDHSQSLQLGQAIDQRLGNSFRQILAFGSLLAFSNGSTAMLFSGASEAAPANAGCTCSERKITNADTARMRIAALAIMT